MNVAGLFDADSLRAHRFGDLGEIGVLEIHAKGDHPGLLLLDVDEVEGFIIEDDLNHRSLSLHLRQQVAQSQHREAPVAAQGNRLPAWIRQLRAERIGRGIGHGRPGKRAEKPAISAALDVPCQPYACRASVGEKHRVVGGEFA